MSKLGNVPHRYARYAEIMFYEDASGWQTFKYGKLGELTENIRTFAPPFENQAYTFNMYFEYDSWNRIQIITYPDGEKVSYDYNRGGMLESVIGDKNGDTYKYIEEIRYNPFEQKESVHYGNGTVTDYSYDAVTGATPLAVLGNGGSVNVLRMFLGTSISLRTTPVLCPAVWAGHTVATTPTTISTA